MIYFKNTGKLRWILVILVSDTKYTQYMHVKHVGRRRYSFLFTISVTFKWDLGKLEW